MRIVVLIKCILSVSLVVGLTQTLPGAVTEDAQDKINLALRRTADKLLRASGDTTSRIPAIEHVSDRVWQVKIIQSFRYDTLPALLDASLAQYGIHDSYQVTVRTCDEGTIDLGYHQQDFLRDTTVPCMSREEPEGCHYIEVTFLTSQPRKTTGAGVGSLLLLTLLTGAGTVWWLTKRKSPAPVPAENEDGDWLQCGRTRLNPSAHMLECNGVREQLTYREAKLLALFFTNPGELLERDRILRDVWADEGVQVGRSVDMFVSRLRKKIKSDPSISIVAVHGVGYRLLMKDV